MIARRSHGEKLRVSRVPLRRFDRSLGVVGLLLAALTPSTATGQMVPDSLLISAASHIIRGRPNAERAWPGFTVGAEFVLCRGDRQTLVVTGDAPPSDLGTSTPVRLGGSAAPNAFVYSGRLPELPPRCFTLSYPLGDRRILAFPTLDGLYSITDPLLASVVAVYHEEFHRHQRTHFGATRARLRAWRYDALEAGLSIPPELLHSADFQRLARRERELLIGALTLPASDTLRQLLRIYLSVRATRMRLLPVPLRGAEPHEERKEASAQLVGYTLGLLAVEGDASRLVEILRNDLRGTPPFDAPGRGSGGAWRSWHIYAAGAAIGVLLDRLGARWRDELQDGATLFALLARAVEHADPDADDVMTVLPHRELPSR